MSKKRKNDDVNSESKPSGGGGGDGTKKCRKEMVESSESKPERGKKSDGLTDGHRTELKKEPGKPCKASGIFTDSSSSSSDSESEQNSKKNNSNSNSNSDSESESSSDSSRSSSKEDVKPKQEVPESVVTNSGSSRNSVSVMPAKSYPSACQRSSSSDSYHSDTEEEDKKRRKKQKKLLQMQLNKKAKRSNLPRTVEIKQEVQSDEEGPDSIPHNDVNDLPAWPESDYAELIKRMEAQIPPKDNQKFDSRASKLDWSKIAFSKYSAEECMEVWSSISKRIRRYRILSEILQDAREWVRRPWTNFYRGPKKNRHPDMPPRPLSMYMIYYLEHKDKVAKQNPGMDMTQVSKLISEMYKDLSPEERDRYNELAAKERKAFEAKLSDFYKEHPELAEQNQKKNLTKDVITKGPRKAYSPFKLFLEQLLKKRGTADRKAVEEEAREKWKRLNEKKKLVFINWALEDLKRYEEEVRDYSVEHPDYVPPPCKSVLNKEEKLIKEKLAGKPVKPPNSAYSLFSRIMLQGDPGVKSIPPKQRMAEISRKWKQIPETEKYKYEEEVRQLQDTYKLEFASYLEGLPEEDRELELQSQSKKSLTKKKASKSEQKAKKRTSKSAVVNKHNRKTREEEEDSWQLYKGEPKPPPVNAFDIFVQTFQSQRNRSEKARMKEAQKVWDKLPESKKEVYEKQLDSMKQKYIKDFEIFLKSLTKPQLKEFSQLKELTKQTEPETSGTLNGKAEESNEDSDDEDGSSSDSDSDDSDSGKSSKSSSSSGDSES